MKIYEISHRYPKAEIREVEVDSVKGLWYVRSGRRNAMKNTFNTLFLTRAEAKEELLNRLNKQFGNLEEEIAQVVKEMQAAEKL